MSPTRRAFLFAAPALAVGAAVARADDPKPADKDAPAPKGKGQLPPGWKKLGLTDEQLRKVYAVETKYRGQIDELTAKIAELKKQQRAELLALLTPAQRERLKEVAEARAGVDEPKKEPAPSKDPSGKKP
jgi:Spy/CpxP family protein refolding chaperone